MIPRYTRQELAAIWDPRTRYRIWFEIEAHAADAMAELGIIPKSAAQEIWHKGKNATFDPARIDAIEREVKHDVIAFHPDRRCRQTSWRHPAARLRAQAYPHDRALPRHPRGAHQLRAQARLCLCGIRAGEGTPHRGAD